MQKSVIIVLSFAKSTANIASPDGCYCRFWL